MDRKTFNQTIAESREKRDAISKAKSDDYAGAEEVLGNFKRTALMLSTVFSAKLKKPLNADDVALIYIILKIDRYANLTGNSKVPNNEGIEDTIHDMQNYVELFEACYKDRTMPAEAKKVIEQAKTIEKQFTPTPTCDQPL